MAGLNSPQTIYYRSDQIVITSGILGIGQTRINVSSIATVSPFRLRYLPRKKSGPWGKRILATGLTIFIGPGTIALVGAVMLYPNQQIKRPPPSEIVNNILAIFGILAAIGAIVTIIGVALTYEIKEDPHNQCIVTLNNGSWYSVLFPDANSCLSFCNVLTQAIADAQQIRTLNYP